MSNGTSYTPLNQIPEIVKTLRKSSDERRAHSFEWRREQLKQLRKCLQENENLWNEALNKDLKMNTLTSTGEMTISTGEIKVALEELENWAKPEKRSLPLLQFGATGLVYKEPLGLVLIISPWNYPLSLITRPLIGAIAAGNCVIIKPSELSANTANLVAELFPKYLDNNCIRVITGGAQETTELLKHKFDHILYTGNGTVAKIIMRAAAEHLTPVTLELGGKSPCVVDKDVDIKAAAKRICFGKYYNCGQTCVAPDYVLVHKDIQEKFLSEMVSSIKEFYGENPRNSDDYGKIINTRHAHRVADLIKSEKIYYGGDMDPDQQYISPTIVVNPSMQSKIMEDEIFGPVMPVISIDNVDEAINIINSKSKPLALYVFSKNTKVVDHVLSNTSSGGGCVNETLFHVICPDLPFGGVGESGIGSYGGKGSFDTFSHERSILMKSLRTDPSLRFPPFTPNKVKWLLRLTTLTLPKMDWVKWAVPVAALGVAYLGKDYFGY